MNDEERQQRAVELSQQAIDLDNAGNYRAAFDCYLRALDQWAVVCKYQKNPVLQERFCVRMKEYLERAEALKRMLNENAPVDEFSKAGDAGGGAGGPAFSEQVDQLSKIQRPNVKWSDIAGLEAAKESLQEAVVLPLRFPNLFTGALKPWRGILLYGPPGTGKTYLAQACATEIAATFLPVSSSDIMSKWQGESEKFVKSLFQTARERAPCVIFIDEIDSLCSTRSEGENESGRRVKTEFLVQMQGVSEGGNGVLVLAATNLPWSLDTAIIRRYVCSAVTLIRCSFDRRIYIPLPDFRARRTLVELGMRGCDHELRSEDFDEVARQTEGFSGSDLNVVVRDARMQPLRKCKDATHFKKVVRNSQTFYIPCSPGEWFATWSG
ncbi:ATPase, AAA family, putative [Babesia bigemina]|uniref:ATPase, AAA family, putative n=1 Tax=Babesia bigemina TaxID=5866 RepID=A0A061D7U2_BABBI|nr:ATPase, AAA family, putative [Babesia bigemina]CDR96062.1 ATPase, AAA family, putative [Babesia bigemina]|eukprot:XP_012768248.1 ATPase, AAA family, putative [Babesia bigemina]